MNQNYDWSPAKNDIRDIKVVNKSKKQELPSEEDEKRFNDSLEKSKNVFQQMISEKNKPYENIYEHKETKSARKNTRIYLILSIIIILLYLIITGYEVTIGTNYEREFDSHLDFTESTKTKSVIDKTYKIESIFNFKKMNTYERKTLSIDNSFKEVITRQDYINKISITGTSQIDIEVVKSTLLKTDISILKYIKGINIHDSDSVECDNKEEKICIVVNGITKCPNSESIGCSKNYYPPIDYTSKIDIIASKNYIGSIKDKNIISEYKTRKKILERWDGYGAIPYELYDEYQNDYNKYVFAINNYNKMIENKVCSSFEYTLNHEIGHTDGARYDDDSEQYADNYANQHTIYRGEC